MAGYVDLIVPDFSTSTKTHKIVSGITAMNSVQEFFTYEMMLGCGIPAVRMAGTFADWQNLKRHVLGLRNLLRPIHSALRLDPAWWTDLEDICDNLLLTYAGRVDPNWWFSIIGQTTRQEWSSGMEVGVKRVYDGWFLAGLLGLTDLKTEDDFSGIESGLVTVPLRLEEEEAAAFIAGIAGVKIEAGAKARWPRYDQSRRCFSPFPQRVRPAQLVPRTQSRLSTFGELAENGRQN